MKLSFLTLFLLSLSPIISGNKPGSNKTAKPINSYFSSLSASKISFKAEPGKLNSQLTVLDPETGYDDTVYINRTVYANAWGLHVEMWDHQEYRVNNAIPHIPLKKLDKIFTGSDDNTILEWVSEIYGAVIKINESYFLLYDESFGDIVIPDKIYSFTFGGQKYITFSCKKRNSPDDKLREQYVFDVSNTSKIKFVSETGELADYYAFGDYNNDGLLDFAYLENITGQYEPKDKQNAKSYYHMGCLTVGNKDFLPVTNDEGEPAYKILAELRDGTFIEEDESHWFSTINK